jgi:gluconate 5-dehydrogenase
MARETEARMNPFSLEDRTALVTGGSRGIGLGIARAFASSGARIILVARHLELEAPGIGELNATAPQLSLAPFDLTCTEAIGHWFQEVCRSYGAPDILVNAAGITIRGEAIGFSLEDWQRVLQVNTTAVFEISRCFARNLIAKQLPGRIINIASLMTIAARRGTAAYTASKGALGQLTKALAVEWAPHGILVNAIAPGYIATELTQELIQNPNFDAWVQQRSPGPLGNTRRRCMARGFSRIAGGIIYNRSDFIGGRWLDEHLLVKLRRSIQCYRVRKYR